jgi:hypothetical protein
MFRCNHHHQEEHYLSLLKQAQIVRSLMVVINPYPANVENRVSS